MNFYRIRNWAALFETFETKRLKKLSWVPIPNKHDGKGYRKLMLMSGGSQHYLAWTLILQVASKCETRGTLIDEDGPITAEDLELKTMVPAKVFQDAFLPLCAIGWLEKVCEESAEKSAVSPADSPQTTADYAGRREGKGREGNRKAEETTFAPFGAMEDQEEPTNSRKGHSCRATAGFVQALYQAYPRKKSRRIAEKAIHAALQRDSFEAILAGVQRYAKERENEDPRFTKHPATWFNADGWKDEPDPPRNERETRRLPTGNTDNVPAIEEIQVPI